MQKTQITIDVFILCFILVVIMNQLFYPTDGQLWYDLGNIYAQSYMSRPKYLDFRLRTRLAKTRIFRALYHPDRTIRHGALIYIERFAYRDAAEILVRKAENESDPGLRQYVLSILSRSYPDESFDFLLDEYFLQPEDQCYRFYNSYLSDHCHQNIDAVRERLAANDLSTIKKEILIDALCKDANGMSEEQCSELQSLINTATNLTVPGKRE